MGKRVEGVPKRYGKTQIIFKCKKLGEEECFYCNVGYSEVRILVNVLAIQDHFLVFAVFSYRYLYTYDILRNLNINFPK